MLDRRIKIAICGAAPGGAALLAAHAVALEGAAPERVLLLPLGTVPARDGRGPYKVGDRAAAEKIVAASRAWHGSAHAVIDYDHQSDFAAVPGVGGTAIAAGWITDFEVRDDGIWGRVEWTQAAAQRIGAKEYRYLSPVFHHAPDGTVLRILRAGLTNKPNLDLVALASAGAHSQGERMPEWLKKLLAALGLPESTTEEAALNAVKALRGSVSRMAVAAGLKDDAGVDAIVTAIQAAKRDAAPDPAKFVPVEQVTALQTQLAELQKTIVEDKATAAVERAIADGKLVPALRQWGLDLYKKDAAAFTTWCASAPVVVKPGQQTTGAPPAGADGLDEGELAVCAQLGISPEDFKKTKQQEAR